jgi:UDPglucose 6-dehydrogenase/GDP-mannose 6-dehydrogenase
MTRAAIIGGGYVGLVTAACLADVGIEVECVDVDPRKVESINAGKAPIHEIGLDEILARNTGRNLRATTDLCTAVSRADVVLIAVGTPSSADGIDLTAVKKAAAQVGEAMRGVDRYQVVAVKSTVVPGTTDGVVLPILEASSGRRAGQDFGVGSNPEFLTEGQAVKDFMEPDRIVVGGIDDRTRDALAALYQRFEGVPMVRVNTRTAEMIKYASNAMLATQISFANELAELASRQGDVDITEVMKGVHLSAYLRPRASAPGFVTAPIASFLEAGCGFGGSCLPKDVTALARHGEQLGADMSLMNAVLHRNKLQTSELVRLLQKHLGSVAGRHIAVLGLAFKPDTDDVRESPAFPVIRRLVELGARVRTYDPIAMAAAQAVLTDCEVSYQPTLRDALTGAEGVAIVTRWPEFADVPSVLRELGANPIVVDGRRMLPRHLVERYEGIGLS